MKSRYNQIANSKNPYQGSKKKALCVCSAGLLRSPTIASVLAEEGYNVRACGTSEEYALIPVSDALLVWADEIHVVQEQAKDLKEMIEDFKERFKHTAVTDKIVIYDIPDCYRAFEKDLVDIIKKQREDLS